MDITTDDGTPVGLTRVTRDPFVLDRDQRFVQSSFDKPAGLWVSVNYGWETLDVMGGTKDLLQVSVDLTDTSKVLVLHTMDDLDRFQTEFDGDGIPFGEDEHRTIDRGRVDWRTVTSRWDGVLVTGDIKYGLKVPFDHWTTAWECASGCIWNLNIIGDITPIVPTFIPELD